jgi:putative ABC transport system permease protein
VYPLAAVTPEPDWRLACVLVALVALAVVASFVGRLDVERDQVTAAARAVAQLAVVSLVIAATLRSLWASLALVLLMYVVATLTAAQRVGVPIRQAYWVGMAIGAGALPVTCLAVGSGVVPLNGAGIIPIAGIVIGGAMSASTLTGRRAYDELKGHVRDIGGVEPPRS